MEKNGKKVEKKGHIPFMKTNPGYPVRKHGEERVPLAVRVFEVSFCL
jgi:hypothetical protein